MKVSWDTNLHDHEGDVYEKCVLLFCGENTILKFKDSIEVESFANQIKSMLTNIKESENDNKR